MKTSNIQERFGEILKYDEDLSKEAKKNKPSPHTMGKNSDAIKKDALEKLDLFIQKQLKEGFFLKEITLNKQSCQLTEIEAKEVGKNMKEFNESLERKKKYCKNRGIDIPCDK